MNNQGSIKPKIVTRKCSAFTIATIAIIRRTMYLLRHWNYIHQMIAYTSHLCVVVAFPGEKCQLSVYTRMTCTITTVFAVVVLYLAHLLTAYRCAISSTHTSRYPQALYTYFDFSRKCFIPLSFSRFFPTICFFYISV